VQISLSLSAYSKSTSLAPGTRAGLVSAVCEALKTLSSILSSKSTGQPTNDANSDSQEEAVTQVVPQAFRDAFACHLYMLFSIMFFVESEAKVGNSLKMGNKGEKNSESNAMTSTRAACANTMLMAAQAMANNRKKLWRRGVADEAVVILPCRIAFQMLETATGVVARKTASADAAMSMIAATVDSTEGLTSTVVAALMDLMHSYEHMAPLCAELCCMVSENPTNRLAVELLREIGRLHTNGLSGGETGGKASGIRNVAPFICELSSVRPRVVLANIAHLMPHLNSEVYNLRSAIVTAIANILSSPAGLGVKEGSQQNETNRDAEMPSDTKSRKTLLEILRERVHDVSSFTRSAVMKAWIQIVQSQSLPVEWFIPVTELAIDRLRDKTILTRRMAMQLLTVILENNPFMGDLNPIRYRAKLEELTKFVEANLPEDLRVAQESALDDNGEEKEENATNLAELRSATMAAAIAEAESLKDEDGLTEQQELFRSKVKALKFTQACLDFVELFENSNDAFQSMLLSSNSSDTTEALRFFVQARLFKLPCAVSGMKNALTLMWSTEQAIRDEVRKAFIEVFLAEPGTDGKDYLPHEQIAENLLILVGAATISELASIEEAIISLVKDEKIPANVFLILWSIVSKGSRDAKASAMLLISMAAGAEEKGRVIVDSKSRLKLLLDSCLGDHAEEQKDWRLVRAASCALQKVERAVVDEGCAKYLVLDRILDQLAIVCRGDWCVDERHQDTLEWFSASEEAIKAVFQISPFPEESSAEIVRGMYMQTFKNGTSSACHSLRLARFFHVLGNVALNLLCYTEALSSGVRHANAKKTLQKQVEADSRKAQKAPSSAESDSEDEIEAELGIAAAVEAETERQMSEITETEILGSGLNAAFVPLLVKVVGNEGGNFNSVILMQASMLALCKFMCVSASFCEKHLPLVFSALARAPEGDTTMRANTVVALSDLAFRFPNEMVRFMLPQACTCQSQLLSSHLIVLRNYRSRTRRSCSNAFVTHPLMYDAAL
jgi:condensin complex subunit 1